MTSVSDRPYLSIGEVLGLLLEEFPDITISKIRFLESQGLIEPERTPSGYRKFYDGDVERLRVILHEQRENFLPLKVIRRRLETGEIDDPSGGFTPPRGIRNVTAPPAEGSAAGSAASGGPTGGADGAPGATTNTNGSPSTTTSFAGTPSAPRSGEGAGDDRAETPAGSTPSGERLGDVLAPVMDPTGEMAPLEVPRASDGLDAAEVCRRGGIAAEQLDALVSFGLVPERGARGYTPGDLAVVQAASGFLARGIEARHLRGWKQAVDREAGLFEQLVLPYLRQRNPQSRREAVEMLQELARLGGELRAALLHTALQHHLDD